MQSMQLFHKIITISVWTGRTKMEWEELHEHRRQEFICNCLLLLFNLMDFPLCWQLFYNFTTN